MKTGKSCQNQVQMFLNNTLGQISSIKCYTQFETFVISSSRAAQLASVTVAEFVEVSSTRTEVLATEGGSPVTDGKNHKTARR